MRDLASFYGFPTNEDHRFSIGARRYRVGSTGVRTLMLLCLIYERCSTCPDHSWATVSRPDIRQVQANNARHILNLVVKETQDPVLRILAIWLRGRCRGSSGIPVVAMYCDHPDAHTRKEVARALKRMAAWRELSLMARGDDNPRIRRIAACQTSRPISNRISNLTRHFARRPVPTVNTPLFVSKELDIDQGRVPKSPALIRAILERIQRLLAGHPE